MVTQFLSPNRAKAARLGGPTFALILLCLCIGAAGQTKAPTTGAAPKTAKKRTASAPSAPTAVIHTTAGDMKCELLPQESPHAVANFIGLSRGTKAWTNPATGKPVHGKPLYDGVTFHRVIPDFMIQAGDPTGTGHGDVGIAISDELRPDLLFDQPGRLAMANVGGNPASSGSQFFITEKALPSLDPCLEEPGCPKLGRPKGTGYLIFGQCDADTVELVKKISRMPCTAGPVCNDRNSVLQNPVKITHIDIQGAGKSAPGKPATKKPSGQTSAQPKSAPN